MTLASGAPPNVTLNEAGSLINEPRRVHVIDNVLYVGTINGTGYLAAFRLADKLTNAQAPDFVLGGPSGLDDPLAVAVVPGRLYVANRFGDFGVRGFDDPAALVTGSLPDVSFDSAALLVECQEMESFARSLWVSSWLFPAVYGYRDATSLVSNQLADIFLNDPTMIELLSLVVCERE